MNRLTLKNLWARKFRVLSLLGIILTGVGFMAGVFVLKDTINKTFDDLFTSVYADASAVVRGTANFTGGDTGTNRDRIPATLTDRVRAVPSVAGADGIVQSSAQAVDRKGKTIGGGGAPTFAYNWPSIKEANPYRLVGGRAPEADDEVVIDRLIATKGPYAVGDQVPVLTSAGNQSYKVVGVATFGTADSAGGSTAVLFTTAKVQQLAGVNGEVDEILAVARPGVSQTQVRDDIAKAIDGTTKTEVLTAKARAAESASDVKKALGFFSTFLLVFAFISIFVGMFVIYNMFKITVDQRTREMALLRAIGASGTQVRRSILLESTITGVVGSVLGIGFGLGTAAGLKGLLKAFGLDLPATGLVLAPRTVVVALVVGLLTTVVSAYFPARRAAKVPPIAALRDVAIDRSGSSAVRLVIGLVMLGLAGAALAAGLLKVGITLVGLSFVLAILGVAVLGPVIARPLSRLIGRPLPSLRGMTGTLARENASRNPKRTSATALALTIGVALVSGVLVMASSIKSSVASTIDKQIAGDFVVLAKNQGGVSDGFSPKLASDIGAVKGVGNVTALRITEAKVGTSVSRVTGTDPATVTKVVNAGKVQGSLAGLGGDTVAVSETYAKDHGTTIGATLPVQFTKAAASLKVVAIYEKADLLGTYLVGNDTLETYTPVQTDSVLLINLAGSAKAADVRPALDTVITGYPSVELQDRTEFKDAQAAQVNQLLALVYVLLAFAIIIALFGIANTLSLSIHERRREMGLLRAVGQFRSQVRSSVRWESAIIAVFGTLLGLVVGVSFGVAIVKALGKNGLKVLTIPVSGLVVITVLGALAGIMASVRPAWRASKLNILQAIATD